MAGIEMVHAPYRGAAPAMNDLIPGRVHLLFSGGATLDNARSGQVQVLGYTGARRAAIAPEVPTIAEDGVPGFEVVSWYGFFVPAKTPVEIIAKMNADTIAALADRQGTPGAVGVREQPRSSREGRGISQIGSRALDPRDQASRHRSAGLNTWLVTLRSLRGKA
jgi:hypothetical protein